MTIGALFLIAVGAILKFPATVDVAGIELFALIGDLVLGLWVLWARLSSSGRVPRPDQP